MTSYWAVVAPLGAAVLLGSQTPSFRSTVDLVRVDVLVTDDGRPVPGLAAADFEVFDNGVRQQVTVLSADDLPIRVLLALDLSESVDGGRLADLQTAARLLVGSLRPDDRADRRVAGEAPLAQPTTAEGFDWADAGIGSAATLGLVLLVAGGSVVVLRHGAQTA